VRGSGRKFIVYFQQLNLLLKNADFGPQRATVLLNLTAFMFIVTEIRGRGWVGKVIEPQGLVFSRTL
jgi:hypothetical protein